MPQLICRDLCLGYDGKEILHHLNFTVNAGDYLCIIGENGAGKSTLMKAILGLQSPLHGEILTGDGLQQKDIGYLPQQTEYQKDFPATVWEIVLSGCQNQCGLRPFYNQKEKETAVANIKKMGIEALTKTCYRDLSGGQKQRVLLARALCAAKKMLLLDEPVAGLDAKITADMYQLINTLNREGMTIVMISHDIQTALHAASHILCVGEEVFFGTKEAYLKGDMQMSGITAPVDLSRNEKDLHEHA